MDFESQGVVNQELTSAERLVWTGIPKRGLRFRKIDIPIFLFMSFWMVISLTMFRNSLEDNPSLMSKVIYFVMLSIGTYMLVGRFFFDAWKRYNTYYGLTTTRAIIVTDILWKNVKSVYLDNIVELDLSRDPDSSGTITFGKPKSTFSSWSGSQFDSTSHRPPPPPAFEMIENVQQVYDQLMNLRKELT